MYLTTTAATWLLLCSPVQEYRSHNTIMADVGSMTRSVYEDRDIITATHETTHFVNSELHNASVRAGRRKRCCYVLHGRYFALEPITTVTMRQVAQAIPVEMRTSRYATYCVTSQQWYADDPLYLADELTSYINGAEARKVAGITERVETIEFAYELLIFVLHARNLAERQEDLEAYLRHECERLRRLHDLRMKNHGAYVAHVEKLDGELAKILRQD